MQGDSFSGCFTFCSIKLYREAGALRNGAVHLTVCLVICLFIRLYVVCFIPMHFGVIFPTALRGSNPANGGYGVSYVSSP